MGLLMAVALPEGWRGNSPSPYTVLKEGFGKKRRREELSPQELAVFNVTLSRVGLAVSSFFKSVQAPQPSPEQSLPIPFRDIEVHLGLMTVTSNELILCGISVPSAFLYASLKCYHRSIMALLGAFALSAFGVLCLVEGSAAALLVSIVLFGTAAMMPIISYSYKKAGDYLYSNYGMFAGYGIAEQIAQIPIQAHQ